jgi:uncharacterized protein (TIGR02466 family)
MNFAPLFPTLVGHTNKESSVPQILDIAKSYLSDDTKLFRGCDYKTTYGYVTNDTVDPMLSGFCDLIREASSSWLTANNYQQHPIKSINIFFNEMHNKDYHPRHSHANSHLSGVFYLSTPEGSGEFCFIDPSPVLDVLDLSCGTYTGKFKIKPKAGLLIVFPSWLEHEVEPCGSAEARISAPFNIVYGLP